MLLGLAGAAEGFSTGAPVSACRDELEPRHGFPAQPASPAPPLELVMDRHALQPAHYLRVTLRSRRAFRGFLISAHSGEQRNMR